MKHIAPFLFFLISLFSSRGATTTTVPSMPVPTPFLNTNALLMYNGRLWVPVVTDPNYFRVIGATNLTLSTSFLAQNSGNATNPVLVYKDGTYSTLLRYHTNASGQIRGIEAYSPTSGQNAFWTYDGSMYANFLETVNLSVLGGMYDGANSTGTSGQVLTSTGTGVVWRNATGGTNASRWFATNEFFLGTPGGAGDHYGWLMTPTNAMFVWHETYESGGEVPLVTMSEDATVSFPQGIKVTRIETTNNSFGSPGQVLMTDGGSYVYWGDSTGSSNGVSASTVTNISRSVSSSGNATGATNFWGVLSDTNLPSQNLKDWSVTGTNNYANWLAGTAVNLAMQNVYAQGFQAGSQNLTNWSMLSTNLLTSSTNLDSVSVGSLVVTNFSSANAALTNVTLGGTHPKYNGTNLSTEGWVSNLVAGGLGGSNYNALSANSLTVSNKITAPEIDVGILNIGTANVTNLNAYVTNTTTNFVGTFTGDGSGLTNLSLSLTNITIPQTGSDYIYMTNTGAHLYWGSEYSGERDLILDMNFSDGYLYVPHLYSSNSILVNGVAVLTNAHAFQPSSANLTNWSGLSTNVLSSLGGATSNYNALSANSLTVSNKLTASTIDVTTLNIGTANITNMTVGSTNAVDVTKISNINGIGTNTTLRGTFSLDGDILIPEGRNPTISSVMGETLSVATPMAVSYMRLTNMLTLRKGSGQVTFSNDSGNLWIDGDDLDVFMNGNLRVSQGLSVTGQVTASSFYAPTSSLPNVAIGTAVFTNAPTVGTERVLAKTPVANKVLTADSGANLVWSDPTTGGAASTNFNYFTNLASCLASPLATNGAMNYIASYWGSNGLGAGFLGFYAGSTAQTNLGTVFAVPAGRIIRNIDGVNISFADFGARPGSSADITFRMQACINECISNRLALTIRGFQGAVTLTNALVLALPDGSNSFNFVGPLTIKGGDNAPVDGTLGTSCELYVNNRTNSCFVIQHGRNITISGWYAHGRNSAYPSNFVNAAAVYDWTQWITPGVSTNQYSPHAFVAIDPFSYTVASSNRYPLLDSFYPTIAGATGGSTRCDVDNNKVLGFYIGVANGIGSDLNSGESINAMGNTFDYNFCAYAAGQDQTKSCKFAFNNVRYCYSALNSGLIHENSGVLPYVIGGDWIQCANLFLDGVKGMAYAPYGASYVFAENLVRIGSFRATQQAPVTFLNCSFQICDPNNYRPEQHVYSQVPVKFIGCRFQGLNYEESGPVVVTPSSSGITFEFDSCFFNENEAASFGTPTNFQAVVSGFPESIKYKGSQVFANVVGGSLSENTVEGVALFTNRLRYLVPAGARLQAGTNIFATAYSLSNSSGTAFWATNAPAPGFLEGTNTTYWKRLRIGDHIYRTGGVIYGAVLPESPANSVGDYVGRVAVVSSNYIKLDGCPNWATNSSNWSNMKLLAGGLLQRLMWKEYRADLISGTNTFTLTGASDWRTQYRVRDEYGAIPAGVYITNISGTTVYLSDNITATRSNALLFDAFVLPVNNETNLGALNLTSLNTSNLNLTGPAYSTDSSTSNAPANNQLVSAGWVRTLFNNGEFYYTTTNIDTTATNADAVGLVYKYQSTIPDPYSQTYAGVTNNQYISFEITTNSYSRVDGPILVNFYAGYNSGGARAVSMKPEVYFSYDKTNWFGDYDCQAQSLAGGSNQYQFVISFPSYTATNSQKVYVQRRLKIASQTSNPDVTIYGGTNTASHMSWMTTSTSTSSGITVAEGTNTILVTNGSVVTINAVPGTGTASTNPIVIAPGSLVVSNNALITGSLGVSGLTNSGTVIFTNGNVGIGTNNPQAALHVQGTNAPYVFQVSTIGASLSNGTNVFSVETNGNITCKGIVRGASAFASYYDVGGYGLLRGVASGVFSMNTSLDFTQLILGTNSVTATNQPAIRKLANGTTTSPGGLMITDAANTNGAVFEIHAIPAWLTNNAASADCARFYVTTNNAGNSAEMMVVDEAGNHTLLSPHAMDAPDAFYQVTNWTAAVPTIRKSINTYKRNIEWKNETLQTLVLQWQMRGSNVSEMKLADALYAVESFDDYNRRTGNTLGGADWETVQKARLAEYDAKYQAACDEVDFCNEIGDVREYPVYAPVVKQPPATLSISVKNLDVKPLPPELREAPIEEVKP